MSELKTGASRAPDLPVSGGGRSRAGILMVDDQPARLLTYEAILTGLDVDCVRAHSGVEALEKLLKQEFAVILLDIHMPGMDGFEVARAVREHPRLESTPIIFVTGVRSSELDRLRGYELGAIDYISVPVVPEILRSKVAVLVELYARRRELQALNRERAALALRETERRNRALVENAPVGIAHESIDGRFEYVNEAFCAIVGYSADDLRGMTWRQIMHPEDIEKDVVLRQRAITGELPHYTLEMRCIRKDGSAVWVSLFRNFVRDDGGAALQGVAIAIDVTNRKLAERALHESQERLVMAKSAAQIGIYDWDIEANVIRWDERVYDLWGFDPAMPVTYEMFASGVHPDDLRPTQQAIEKALDPNGAPRVTASYRVINRRDGTLHWIEGHGHAFFENGRAKRLIGTVQDITEKKIAEQRLRDSDRRKDEFLAMLAHELRNPIAPIRNAAEVLTRLVGDAQSRALVSMIQRQGAHLSRILDDLLDAARITQGRIELRREVISVAGCIEHALEAVQPQIHADHLDLAFTRTAEPLFVHADRVRLEQCIGNLLSNAVKFSEPHGAIRVRLFAEDGNAVIEVRDFGIGIEPELVSSMFELFAQGARALDRAEGGLGIGLSVCKQLIEMHGGSVTGFSAGLGCGATFTLRIPLHREPEQARLPNMPEAEAARRVLIVDDNRDAADSLAMCLQLEGHQTKAVYSGEGALEQLGMFHPEIVLLDIGLPCMDGYEVASRIRSTNRGIRVIALTGYGQDEDRRRASAAGFDAHLVKPVDIAALRTTLGGG